MDEDRLPRSEISVVILCGGQGTRIREASESLPKPLVDIGGRPILWHILKTYGMYGFRHFILCLGYKSWDIKRYFLQYRENVSDFSLRLAPGHGLDFHDGLGDENWEITFAETGLNTGTGARLRRARQYIRSDTFLMTYGDGVGSVDIGGLLDFHRKQGRLGTVTGVHPSSRYGELAVDGQTQTVVEFAEKPTVATGWVSAGFFAFERSFAEDYLDDDPGLFLEHRPLQELARDGQLSMYPHEGFWMGMDTYRDYLLLNQIWDAGDPPWRLWTD